jgi:cytidyltransferase-like protein
MTSEDDDAPVRVYIDLIGDLFHWGHVRQIERAKALGDVLVVGVIGDDDAEALSHRPVATLEERVAVIAACRHVDEVVPGAPPTFDDAYLDRYGIDLVCLSDDFGNTARQDAFAALADGDRAVVLPYVEDISTAALVERIVGRAEAGPALPRSHSLSIGPVIHPPPATMESALSALRAGQGRC